MLIQPAHSMLLVVDVQAKLVPAIHDGERVVEHAAWLVRAAQRIGIPVGATEQYPQGLGPTVAAIASLLPPDAIASKVHFSCAAAKCLGDLPGWEREQVVIAGMEAHVCVLQTALGLVEDGRDVFVVADAVGSRRESDREHALARMRQNGVQIVTREMVVFEWLQQAGTDLFRDVSRTLLR